MRDFFQGWLDQRGSLPGVLLCGISLADHTCLGCSSVPDYPVERLDQILTQLVEFSRGLGQHRLTATRLLWTFENAQLHWIVRPDNVSLALFTPADPRSYDSSIIESLLGEFLQMEPQT